MTPRPPLDEVLALFQATVAAEGTTTLAGAATGDSIVDAGLAGSGANSFLSMLMVVYPGQPRLVDSMDITGFDDVTGEVTFDRAYKGVVAAIPAGVPYKIVTFRFVPAEVAAIEAKLDALALICTAADVAQATGTFAFDESAAGEQTIFSVVVAARAKVGAIWLDLNTLTLNNTIRIKHKIDGATYRTFSTHAWVFATDDKGVLLEGFTAYRDFQVSMQCAGGGAAGKNVPYAVV